MARTRDSRENLILDIHEASQDIASWTNVLTRISDLGIGESLNIGRVCIEHSTPHVVSATRFPDYYQDLVKKFENPENDSGIRIIKNLKNDYLFVQNDVFRFGEFERTRIYHDVYRTLNLFPYYIKRLFNLDGYIYAFMGHHKNHFQPFEAPHRRLIDFISKHVALSLRLTIRLESSVAAGKATIEALQYASNGIFLVDTNLSVLFANRAAEQMVRMADGLYVRRGRLEAARRSDTVQLERLVKEASQLANGTPPPDAGAGTMLLQRPSAAQDFPIFVAPLVQRNDTSIGKVSPTAAVFVSDPQASIPAGSADALRKLYGLTAAEAKVALTMCEGQGMSHVAETMKLSLATVKTHQRAIFQKLDVKSQAELTKRLHTSAALLHGEPDAHPEHIDHRLCKPPAS